ncbi:MAG: hypothetical protein HY974_02795 [Candidatus Kerfeldbacteria bacterium]|nr:hypothetical protein [Candidatus Kerfeldbacteria bacterium]
MSNLKKIFTIGVTTLTVIWSVGVASLPLGASAAASAGDLIKMAGNPAVYYFDGSKRFVFPNSTTYFSWYKDFSGVKTVASSELQSYAIGGNVTMRPGTKMVKITTDPKVYAVSTGGTLHAIDSEARALKLYGSNWNKMIVDVPDAFFVNYKTGAAINSDAHVDGTLVKYAGSSTVYVVDGGKKRPLASDAAVAANMFSATNAVTTDITYADGTSITGAESTYTNVAGSSAPAVVGGTGLSVALASDTPVATTLASGSAYNPVAKFNFTAGSDGAVSITGLKLTKGGILANTNIAGVGAFDAAGKRHGNFVTSLTSDNMAVLTFTSDPITVPAGQTASVTIKVNALAGAYTGTANFSLAAASAVTSASSATVSGTFPVMGNTFSFVDGSASIAGMTFVTLALGNTTADIGVTDFQTTRFRVSETSGKENLKLTKVALYNNGNASDSDVKDIKLYNQDGTLLATSQMVSKYASFDLSASPLIIPTGTSRDLTVKLSVVDGSTRTVILKAQESFDIEAYGTLTGSGILSSSTFPTTTPDTLTINSGDVTLSKSSASPSGKIAVGAKDVVLATYDIRPSGENFEFRNFYYSIKKVTTNFTGTVKFQVGGETVYSVAAADAKMVTSAPGTTAANYANPTLTSYKTLNSGTTYQMKVVADISSSALSTDNYVVYVGALYGKRLSSNDFITKPAAITTTAGTASNTLTVDTTSLSLSKNTAYPDSTIVGGSSNQKIGSFSIQAGSAEGVNVTSIKVILSVITGYQNVTLKKGSTALGNAISTPTVTTGDSVSMNPTLVIPASGSVIVDVYADTTGSALDTVVTMGTLVGTGVSSASSITTPANATGQSITVSAGGALTVSADSAGTPAQQLIHADEVDKEVYRFKVASNNVEDLKLNTLHVVAYNGAVNFQNFKLYDVSVSPAVALGGTVNLVSNDASFSGLNFTVPKATTKTLSVRATANSSGTLSVTSNGTWNAFADFGLGEYDYTGAAGITYKSGGTWSAYTIATDTVTVNNISLFTNGSVVYMDASGNGALSGTTAGITETTGYYVISATATSGTAGTIQLSTTSGGSALDIITANGTVGGGIYSFATLSNNMLVADVEPTVTLTAGQVNTTASPQAAQELVKFDFKADGSRDMTLNGFTLKSAGSYLGTDGDTLTTTRGITSLTVWQGGSSQAATVTLSATDVKLDSGETATFALTSPIVITAGQTVTLTVKGNTSQIRGGTTTQSVTAQLYLNGVAGATYSGSSSTNGLSWTYSNINATSATAETSVSPAGLSVSDSYPVNGPTYTY